MPIKGRIRCIDHCIHHLVAALNAANITTVASCCGHNKLRGSIDLEDGRTLIIIPTPQSLEEWGEVVLPSSCGTQESNGSNRRP